MTSLPARRSSRAPGVLGLSAAVCLATALLLGCPAQPRKLVYDLAARAVFGERWSLRETILFGTPAAEPHQTEGFYREAVGARADPFVWARREAEISLTWPQVAPREAVVELSPFRGVESQAAEVRLNGTSVAHFKLNDLRHRYAIPLPAAAQRVGDNRLRFVFEAEASPADEDAQSADRRTLAAAFYSLTLGAADDGGVDDLLARDAPGPFAVVQEGATPSLTLVGPAVLRYAVRLPAGAELRFTPALHPAARAAGGAASFRVTLQERDGKERQVWEHTISARDPDMREVAVAIPGAAGAIVRVGLQVGGAPADRFAWGIWTAPRILGREAAPTLEPRPRAPDEAQRGSELRAGLAGSNALLVILDAARAREFGTYAYGRATTPEIDRIAGEGVVFENAFTPAVYTLGAMASVWTSQYPDRHHSEVSFSARLPRNRLTLAELLGARGIVSAGFVANAVAGSAFGFDRGFAEFREIFKDLGSGADGFRKVVPQWLAAHKDGRFFAYLHFREPHFPYDPPPPYDTRFGPDGPIAKAARADAGWLTDFNQGRRRPAAGEIEHLVRLYDGNLAFADHELGLLRRQLEEQGLWERTVVIIAADHGEELFEHSWIGHNVHLYEESVHVPLIVRFPKGKGPSGARVRGLVDLLDVAPTITDILGVSTESSPIPEFQGRSLLPVIGGAPGKTALLSRTVWDRPRYALRDDRFKYVYDTRTGDQELFDLAADPQEAHDLVSAEPLLAAYYREALHQWLAGLAVPQTGAAEATLPTREQCENLKALGYTDAECR